jgi:hypothetical protein
LDPAYSTVYNNLAFAYEKNEQLDKAYEALDKYLNTIEDAPERAVTEAHMKDLLNKGARP